MAATSRAPGRPRPALGNPLESEAPQGTVGTAVAPSLRPCGCAMAVRNEIYAASLQVSNKFQTALSASHS